MAGERMEKYVILGGAKLEGEVEISGAKNSAVALIVASLLVLMRQFASP